MRLTPHWLASIAPLLLLGSGCAAMGLQADPRLGGLFAGSARPLTESRIPGIMARAGDSIFAIVPWILALAVAAVVVTLLVKTLRGNAILPGVH